MKWTALIACVLVLGACAKGLDLSAQGSIHHTVRFTLSDDGPGYHDPVSHFIVYEINRLPGDQIALNPVWHLAGKSQVREILYGHAPEGLKPPRGAHGHADKAPPPALVPGRAYLAYAYASNLPAQDALIYFNINWDGTVGLPEQDTQTFSKLVRALEQHLRANTRQQWVRNGR